MITVYAKPALVMPPDKETICRYASENSQIRACLQVETLGPACSGIVV